MVARFVPGLTLCALVRHACESTELVFPSRVWLVLLRQPENILCGDRIVDIKLADFGLSHLVNPHERMHMACGTLSYVGESL